MEVWELSFSLLLALLAAVCSSRGQFLPPPKHPQQASVCTLAGSSFRLWGDRLSHLEDLQVVLRFFYQLSDCKVHSLFVAGKEKTGRSLLAGARSPPVSRGEGGGALAVRKQPGTIDLSPNVNL